MLCVLKRTFLMRLFFSALKTNVKAWVSKYSQFYLFTLKVLFIFIYEMRIESTCNMGIMYFGFLGVIVLYIVVAIRS